MSMNEKLAQYGITPSNFTPEEREGFKKPRTLTQAEILENIRRTNARRSFAKSRQMNTVLPVNSRLNEICFRG